MPPPLFLLLALTTTQAASPPPAAWHRDAETLSGQCEAGPQGPRGRIYECPTFSANVSYTESVLPEDKLLEHAAQVLRMTLEDATGKNVSLKLGDATVKAWEFIQREEGAPDVEGHVVVRRLPSGLVQTSMCAVELVEPQRPEACRKALTYFTTRGIPEAGLDLERTPVPTPHRFLSRTLTVPARCTLVKSTPAGGRIDCPDGAFVWLNEVDDEAVIHQFLTENPVKTKGGRPRPCPWTARWRAAPASARGAGAGRRSGR